MQRIVPIKGYEKEYMIADDGTVFRIENNSLRVMKKSVDKDGYFRVCLCKGNNKKSFFVHRLVAEMFIPETDKSKNIINHKDENKQNNNVDNLEWCTVAYNTNYNNMNVRRMISRRKPIMAFKNGYEVRFDSITEASKTLGIQHSNILKCLRGERHTAGGYSFHYIQRG